MIIDDKIIRGNQPLTNSETVKKKKKSCIENFSDIKIDSKVREIF